MSFFLKKSPRRQKNLLTALDIGSSKVCCAIAKIREQNLQDSFDIIGTGHQISRGLKNGVITNLEALEDSILNAVHSAEQMAKETIREVYVNFSTIYARSHKIDVDLSLDNRPIDENHIRRLLTLARNTLVIEGEQIIHAIPIAYAIDNQIGIKDPRGMTGEKLMSTVHLVSAPQGLIRNISNCIGRCHLDVVDFIITPYASGLSTLVEDELELGVTVVDMGGGVCNIASFLDGTLIHIDNVPLGGMHITSDIARGLSTPLIQAERLKTLYGTAITSLSDERETITVQQMGDDAKSSQITHVSKSLLTRIIRARTEEILELIWARLQNSGMDRLVCQRVVLTGGGSQLPGIRDLAASMWNKQIRLGSPIGFNGGGASLLSPMFATCAGLLKYAWRDIQGNQTIKLYPKENEKWWPAMLQWVRENF